MAARLAARGSGLGVLGATGVELMDLARTAAREWWMAATIGGFWKDLRYTLRSLRRAPAFTAVAVATLGLGIGANAAIFSVVDGVLLRDLPYEDPDELVTAWLDLTRRDGPQREWFTPADFEDYRNAPGLFAELGAWGGWGPTLTGAGEPVVLTGARVTAGMFEEVLAVQPALGRGFMVEEDRPGG